MFYIAQVFGIIAVVLMMYSFQKNDKGKLLKYQIGSSIFFALQYVCLRATSGALMNLMAAFRNWIFSKFKEKVPIIHLILIVIGMLGLSIVFYDGFFSMFPAVALILYSISLWQDDLRFTRIVEVVGCILFIIYNIKVGAIIGVVSTTIEMLSAIVAIVKFDIMHINK